MSNPRTPISSEFKVSGDPEYVEHSVGNIEIDKNASIEEVVTSLRRMQIEDIIKQGGVSIKTVIPAKSKVKKVTAGAFNIIFSSQPSNSIAASDVEKNEINPNIIENDKSVTAKIPLTGKSDAIIIVEKEADKKNDIKITWHVANFYTGVTIKWGDKQQYKYIEKSGTYHLNAGNFNSSWKTDEEIAAEQRAVSSVSNPPSRAGVSLKKVSSIYNSSSASQYSSSSSAIFKAESKPIGLNLASNMDKLPTVKELNDILGKSDLVAKVEESYAFPILISFDSEISPNSYEHIINKKLLEGISNVNLTKTGNCPRLGISNEVYAQFMKNVSSALEEINNPIIAKQGLPKI